jgi:hypothetical protein
MIYGGGSMTVYIRNSHFPTEVTINKYYAEVGFYLRGEEVVKYFSFDEIPELKQEDVVIDYIYETRLLLEAMSIKVQEIDYPEVLKPFFGRNIREGLLGEIVNVPDNWGKFVKPKEGSKAFTGRVVNGTADLVGIGLPFDYPVWISDAVKFVREWRVYVLHGQVLGIYPYKGDYHAHYDASVIDAAIKTWKDAPAAYGLDIGLTQDGRTLIVEVNDGYALGNYGLNALLMAQFMEARWHELSKPYFTKHKTLKVAGNIAEPSKS